MKPIIMTITDGIFFRQGLLLLQTWAKAASELHVFGYDLNHMQIRIVKDHGAIFHEIKFEDYRERMMFYKIVLIRDMLRQMKKGWLTYIDFDTMVSKPWNQACFTHDYDIGITIRPQNKRSPNLHVNAGVMFLRASKKSKAFFTWYTNVMEAYARGETPSPDFPLYKELCTTERTSTSNLGWWCDQTFLSAIVEEYYRRDGMFEFGDIPRIFEFAGYKIALFPCPQFNDTSEFTLEDLKSRDYRRTRHIIHFKGKRKKVYAEALPLFLRDTQLYKLAYRRGKRKNK